MVTNRAPLHSFNYQRPFDIILYDFQCVHMYIDITTVENEPQFWRGQPRAHFSSVPPSLRFFYKAIEKQKSKKRLTYFLNLISPCQKQIHL